MGKVEHLQLPPELGEIAQILRSERERLGYSLGQVAEESGVSTATLSRFERGRAISYEAARDVIRWLLSGNDDSIERVSRSLRQLRRKAAPGLVPVPLRTPVEIEPARVKYDVNLGIMQWEGRDPNTGEVYELPLCSDGEGRYWDKEGKQIPLLPSQRLEDARKARKIWIEGLDKSPYAD